MTIPLQAAPSPQQTMAEAIADRKGTTLFKRPHPFETFIRFTLLACGLISILTTIGIILVLGSQSLRFFTTTGWIETGAEISTPITATDRQLTINIGADRYTVGTLLTLSNEVLRVTQRNANTLTVERGVNNTQAADHPAGTPAFLGKNVSLTEFLTGTIWQPQAGEFGILPLVSATLMTSLIAMLVAIPTGLGIAIYLSEYASLRTRNTLKPILELLAGVPTVVYGYFALTFMTPLLRSLFGQDTVGTYNQASAGLVMGIMIIPTISSMSQDALSAVPRALREASYGLGATRLETVFRVLLPAALSGILAAIILGISRAVGETMIVSIAAGAGPALTLNPFQAAETMTGHIARISTGDLSFGSIDYNSLFAIGLTLFLITLGLNLLSQAIIKRFREVYA